MSRKIPIDFYDQFKKRFKNYSDLELINSFNSQVGNQGSGSAKMAFLAALREEFEAREIDLTSVSNDRSVSYRNRISLYVLNGKKIVPTI